MLTFANRASVPAHVLVRFMDNEAVLLNLASERYFGLDETGTRMWRLATTAPSIEAAYQELLNEYEVAPELLHTHLHELLLTLVENGLLELLPAENAAASPAV
ncbi:MAG TPA: PqqD family protein [Candidatus Acidoferrum sp.]|nr:PqqD family protein [Candidatus Acidoferrum sp.]